jgi:hypothetical protein
MKNSLFKNKLILIFFVFFSFNLFSTNHLITFPHSSLHWLLYQFTHLSHKKSVGLAAYREWKDNNYHVSFNSWTSLHRDYQEKNKKLNDIFLFHVHSYSKFKFFNINESNKDKLILVLRNYNDCFSRNAYAHLLIKTKMPKHDYHLKLAKDLQYLFKALYRKYNDYSYVFLRHLDSNSVNFSKFQSVDYFQNLYYFDNYQKQKLLVFYEDLMKNPKREMVRMFNFLGEDKHRFNSFYNNLDAHKNESLRLYVRAQGKSFTKGENKNVHVDNLGKDICKSIDEIIKKRHPLLWEKYLNRYETK